MSKTAKRAKSGAVAPPGGAKWEQALLAASFEDEKWKANIAFVVGNRTEDIPHISVLSSVVASGIRKLFSVVSKEDLYAQVKELGNPKTKKPKDVPSHSEVCEPCKSYLDVDEDIPLPLLAKLIKFRLLTIKSTDLKRRDIERKISKQSQESVSDKDKGGKKEKKERSKSPKKGGKKTPEPPSAKEGSKLKKRGEEDQDSKYIDDEPDDGPQHYILIHGFLQPHLFAQLAELGINVDSIICLSSQEYKAEKPAPTPENRDDKAMAAEEAARQERLALKRSMKMFWSDVIPILQQQPEGSKLHDVAKLEYEVQSLVIPQNLEDGEQKTTFGTAMFEEVAVMIYNLLDAKRQYENYLLNLHLLHVPVCGAESGNEQELSASHSAHGAPIPPVTVASNIAQPPAIDAHGAGPVDADMRYYNDLMNCVPQESVSVPLIMHCMLEQVVAIEEGRSPPSEQQPPSRSDGLSNQLASHIRNVTFKLALTEDEHKALSEVFDLPERPPDVPKQPLLMNHQDGITIRTHHLKTIYDFNPEETEKMMLKYLPFNRFTDLPQPSSVIAKERAARLQELIHFCTADSLSPPEIDRAFKQFVFECMDFSATDANGFIITRDTEGVEHSAIPWDDPYPFFKGFLHKHDSLETSMSDSIFSERRSDSDLDDPSRSGTPQPLSSPDSPHAHANSPSDPSGTPTDSKRKSRGKKKDKRQGSSPSGKKRRSVVLSEPDLPAKVEEKTGDSGPEDHSRASSADSRKGIMRSRSSSPKLMRKTSVHFEAANGEPIPLRREESMDHVAETANQDTTERSLYEVIDEQKRTLDQWCFAEQFEPHVLLQILNEASYKLPFIDTYYHKRDHSLLVVLHNPYNSELQNHVDWHTELHSNVGFRNYLEYVSEMTADWTKEEEAKYDAQMLTTELEKIHADEEATAKATKKQEARTKSPKKSPSRAKSPKSRAGSQEKLASLDSDQFVRAGSLKAWKAEQDAIQAEEEEKDRAKQEKRARSPTKKKDQEDKEKDKKRPASRTSSKSKTSTKDPDIEPVVAPEPVSDEPYWPFTGYDVGNNLIHASGIVSTLFPSDGGQIRVERTELIQGTTSIKTTVLKDGHIFTVHILDPKESLDESEDEDGNDGTANNGDNQDTTRPKKNSVSAFGSVCAQLVDGMMLSLSEFGPNGESIDGKRPEPEAYIPPRSPSPTPQVTGSPSKGKKVDKGREKTVTTPDPVNQPEDEVKVEDVVDEDFPEQPFQSLNVTCPDGLYVRYFLESSVGVKPTAAEERRVLVKQGYPFKTRAEQPCEAGRKKYMLSEISRITTSEGTVIKNMVDGSVEILYPDGTVSIHTGSWPMSYSGRSSPQRAGSANSQTRAETPVKKVRTGGRSSKQGLTDKPADAADEATEVIGALITTYPNGDRVRLRSDGTTEEMKPVMISVASDPETKQSMATRDDHVMTVSYPDGTTIVEHADGTRITTYYRDSQIPVNEEDMEETGEVPEYEVQTMRFVKVECPAYATLDFNSSTSESLTMFGNGTSINLFPDGYYRLHHHAGGRLEIDTEGTLIYNPRQSNQMEQILPERDVQYVFRHNAEVIFNTVDSDGNVFSVKYNGDSRVSTASGDEAYSDQSSTDDLLKKDKKLVTYREHAPRFFIIHASGSGTELLRYQDIAEYLTNAEQNPATAVLKDPLADYPGVMGITILRPSLKGPSEKWFKKYDQQSIIPPGIRSRDLTTLPPKEFKTEGPKFGTNVGQGLSVGAAVKSQTRVPIIKCPQEVELRQLIQYKPVVAELRQSLNDGLREYAEYVNERNRATELLQPIDPRDEEERMLAADLQTLSQTQDVQFEPADVSVMYQMAIAPDPPSPATTPQPKRSVADWERDQREIAEEREGREALKNHTIPPYFESELGKSFLLTQAKDIDELMKQLSIDPRQDGTQAVRRVSNGSDRGNHLATEQQLSDRSLRSTPLDINASFNNKTASDPPTSPQTANNGNPTPSALRPGNPTPAHATGQGSPAPVRPKNPTPSHATQDVPDRPVNPTPQQSADSGADVAMTPPDYQSPKDKSYPSIQEDPIEEEEYNVTPALSGDSDLILTRSLKVNVLGQPREETIKLPTSIKGGRPGAKPNKNFQMVEDPVRRKVYTSTVAGATIKGQTEMFRMRGLNVFPENANFGVLREGNTFSFTVYLQNTGIDTCRFKIKQPPPSTGLRVLYKPGPVAAGMRVEIKLELYAIAVGVKGESGVGSIEHNLQIITETDDLYLPVSATVLTAYEYDNRSSESPQGTNHARAILVSTRPPATTGIIRPRKDPSFNEDAVLLVH